MLIFRQGQRNDRSGEGSFDVGREAGLSEACSRRCRRRTQGGVLRGGGPEIFGRRRIWKKEAEEGAGRAPQTVKSTVSRCDGKGTRKTLGVETHVLRSSDRSW